MKVRNLVLGLILVTNVLTAQSAIMVKNLFNFKKSL